MFVTTGARRAQWWHDVLGFLNVHQVHDPNFEVRTMIHASRMPTVVFRDPDNIQLEFYVHPEPDDWKRG